MRTLRLKIKLSPNKIYIISPSPKSIKKIEQELLGQKCIFNIDSSKFFDCVNVKQKF